MSEDRQDPTNSRRNFLRIGAGVVVGAFVAGAGVAAYESSVISSNHSSSSSAVASLSTELATTQSQLSDTQSQLNDAQSSLSDANAQISSLGGQLTSTQGALSSANAQIATLQSQASTASSQASALQIHLDTVSGFLALNVQEQAVITAAAETIIPDDSSGPGANAAGVIYFIDRQLATDYGKSGGMYMQAPFIPPGVTSPITLDGITYSAGTFQPGAGGGYSYQYGLNLREFWRTGIEALETYANSAYGANFESLSAANQVACLTDLWNDKPTSFSDIVPSDFAWELTFMVWSGFLTDPLYGGNQNMVGWQYVAFNGVNMGNFYGEGHTAQELMLATTPTRLQPASLAQYQKGSP